MKNHTSTIHAVSASFVRIALAASLVGLTACALWAPPDEATATANARPLMRVGDSGATIEDIRLRPGDQIEIRIGGIPGEDAMQISGSYLIDGHGHINMPHIGKIKASEHTQADLQQTIQNAYKRAALFTNPTITVNVPVAARFIYLSGDVRAPQRMAFSPDLTLLGAVSAAGGFTDYANQSRVRLLRGADVYILNMREIRSNPAKDVILRPGDKIDVPQSFW